MRKIMIYLLGIMILALGFLLVSASAKAADYVPERAKLYMPVLKTEIVNNWPSLKPRSLLAAQIEQETCASLKTKKCWNPNTELKTEREYGFGLGQITITKRFNVFEETRLMDKSLADWKWEDRFNPAYQIRAIVVKMRNTVIQTSKLTPNPEDRLAFALSAYNGGLGGVLKDRTLCANTKGCDPKRWFGHVENTSYKSRVAVHGYGQSFFDVNRGYVRNVLPELPRRKKYIPYMDS